jgi:hypothetical protein
MTKIWALRSRLEKQPTDLRQNTSYFGDRTLASAWAAFSAGELRPTVFTWEHLVYGCNPPFRKRKANLR